MADPKHPRHYEESFKRQIVQLYENGKPAREIKAEYESRIPRCTVGCRASATAAPPGPRTTVRRS